MNEADELALDGISEESMLKKTGLVCAGLLVGCAAGVAIRDAVVPPAGAQATGKRFQHHCLEVKWADMLEQTQFRADLGDQGWELVAFTGTTGKLVACFKRDVTGT